MPFNIYSKNPDTFLPRDIIRGEQQVFKLQTSLMPGNGSYMLVYNQAHKMTRGKPKAGFEPVIFEVPNKPGYEAFMGGQLKIYANGFPLYIPNDKRPKSPRELVGVHILNKAPFFDW